jgi:hypothetical protein
MAFLYFSSRPALQYERVGAPKYARAALVLDRVAECARREGSLDGGELPRRPGEARAICEAARLIAYRVIDERARQRPLARCVSRTCRHGPGGARCRQPRPRGPGQRDSRQSAFSAFAVMFLQIATATPRLRAHSTR